MSFATAFYLYILPFLITALVWGGVWISERKERRKHRLHPGE